jgi:hypothetical protein
MNTRLEAFAEVVADMRAAQKEYFRLRRERVAREVVDPARHHAQKLERVVDRWLARLEIEEMNGQSALFDTDE